MPVLSPSRAWCKPRVSRVVLTGKQWDTYVFTISKKVKKRNDWSKVLLASTGQKHFLFDTGWKGHLTNLIHYLPQSIWQNRQVSCIEWLSEGCAMRRFMVVGRKKSVWFLLGAVVYVFIILLGLGNMVVSLVSITEKELPIYSVQRLSLIHI